MEQREKFVQIGDTEFDSPIRLVGLHSGLGRRGGGGSLASMSMLSSCIRVVGCSLPFHPSSFGSGMGVGGGSVLLTELSSIQELMIPDSFADAAAEVLSRAPEPGADVELQPGFGENKRRTTKHDTDHLYFTSLLPLHRVSRQWSLKHKDRDENSKNLHPNYHVHMVNLLFKAFHRPIDPFDELGTLT